MRNGSSSRTLLHLLLMSRRKCQDWLLDLGTHCKNDLSFVSEEISGIFVKSIAPASAADISQRIAINDQIIEVDGKSLYGHTNHQAVEVLRHSGSRVQLRLARYLRGAKFNQLQQLVASADASSPPQVPVDESKSSAPLSGSTVVQLERKSSACSAADPDSDSDRPAPPDISFGLDAAANTDLDQRYSSQILHSKWKQIIGSDYLIIVSFFALLPCSNETNG